jgi:hypothetical protein
MGLRKIFEGYRSEDHEIIRVIKWKMRMRKNSWLLLHILTASAQLFRLLHVWGTSSFVTLKKQELKDTFLKF